MASAVFTVRRRDLAWAVALILLVSTIWVARSDLAGAGSEPPGEGIDVVYIAVGTGFADSLGVGPGAAMNSAPIIIVPTNPPLLADTEAELVRLDPRNVIIVGGTGVVSDDMETALSDLLPNADFGRIAGSNRYATNADFSAANYPVMGWASLSAGAFDGLYSNSDVFRTDLKVWNTDDGQLMAGIQLPHNARIIGFEVDGTDTNSVDDVMVTLRKSNTAEAHDIAVVSSSGDSGLFHEATSSITAGHEVVDNEEWGYFIFVSGASAEDLSLGGVLVLYQLGNPEPASGS